MPYPFIYPFVGEMKLILQQGLTSATAQYYMGLSEFEEMSFVLHFIEKEDLFIDVGANVGCFTLLASGVKKANTIAIEPLPSTFQHLCNNLIINKLEENVEVLNIGMGAKEGNLEFTQHNTSISPRSPSSTRTSGCSRCKSAVDRKSTRLNSSHPSISRMPSSA